MCVWLTVHRETYTEAALCEGHVALHQAVTRKPGRSDDAGLPSTNASKTQRETVLPADALQRVPVGGQSSVCETMRRQAEMPNKCEGEVYN